MIRLTENNRFTMEETTERELLTKNYNYAKELKLQGKTDSEIKEAVMAEGLSEEKAIGLLNTLSKVSANSMAAKSTDKLVEDDGDSEGRSNSWIFYVAALVVVNLLSWVFDWPFWIY